MKHSCCLLLIATAGLIFTGCRRSGAGSPREPVPVIQEKDILPVPREKSLLFEARPLDRRYRVYVESIREAEAQLKDASEGEKKLRWQTMAQNQKNQEESKDPDGQKRTSDLLKARDLEDKAFEFDVFGKACFDFLQKKSPKEYAIDEFTKFARRKDIIIPQKFLDKMDWVVATNEIPLTQYLDKKEMIFIPQSDLKLPGGCIIAYHGAGNSGDHWVMLHDGEKMFMKLEAIKDQLRAQELRVLRHHYLAFAASHFLILPAAPQDADWVRSFQVSPSATIDNKIKLGIKQNTKYVKNPPDPRDWLKFKKYMRENAPPPIYKDIVDKVFAVNLDANPSGLDKFRNIPPIACYAKEVKYKASANDPEQTGYWTVDTGGAVELRPLAAVEAFLPTEKKDAKAP